MKTLTIISSILLGAISLTAQNTIKRSSLEIKEIIVKSDVKVKKTSKIRTEEKDQALITPQNVATLPKKAKKSK